MGVVYEVEDRERGKVVALKTVHLPGAEALYRTKQEFRAIADLEHPNLVRLYDLTVEDESCFFTMELVPGVDFVRYCRGPDAPGAPGTRFDEARLRAALLQLARGLRALHAAGKVHRDVKPSNALVTNDGRVVLLDFGLAKDIHGGAIESMGRDEVVGTAAYMSPEQAHGERELTPATDWYALGVMLYEILAGRLPFTGSLLEVLLAKQRTAPLPPSALRADCPPDLDQLCAALLRIDPNDRPHGEEVLRRLGLPDSESASASSGSTLGLDAGFVGRGAQLAALAAAARRVREGHGVVALVHGSSGMGKSALVQHFLGSLRHDHDALVFGGRCYPQESIPYKAIDGIVDSLTRYLRNLPPQELAKLLPPQIAALARLFPVLRRVKNVAVAYARQRDEDVHPADARLRAFLCLRELLSSLAQHKLLVLVIDDVQWADSDSAALLGDLLRGPSALPLFLLVSSRSARAEDSPVLAALERAAQPEAGGLTSVLVPVEPLSDELAARATAALLGRPGDVDAADVVRIVREAAGCPLMLGELARARNLPAAALAESDEPQAGDAIITARLSSLSSAVRRLVDVVALAERPLPCAVALRAAGSDDSDRLLIHKARAAHWLRAVTVDSEDGLDTLHDHVREVAIAQLSEPERRRLHAHIATAFESCEDPPVDRLAFHLTQAGESSRAFHYALRAARAAAAALAFDRAVALYELASTLCGPDGRAPFLPEIARALSHAGRTSEAAEMHLAIAASSQGAERMEHRRLAADNLLRSGHIDRALELLGDVAVELGIPLARNSTAAVVTLLAKRARLFLRGLDYAPRREDELPRRTLFRLDTLGTVAATVISADPVRGMIIQASYVIDALDAGEEERICRALMVESGTHAMFGRPEKAARIARRVGELADRLQTPSSRLWSEFSLGLGAHGGWDFPRAHTHYVNAQQLCRQVSTVTHWELTLAQLYALFCEQFFAGKFRTAAHELEGLIEDARRRNDLHAHAAFTTTPLTLLRLAEDRPEAALASLERALEGWPTDAFYMMHYYVYSSMVSTLQYMGEAQKALEQSLALFRAARQAGLFRLSLVEEPARLYVALSALALKNFDLARAQLKVLRRSKHAPTRGHTGLLEASWHALRGEPEHAAAALREAIPILVDTGRQALLSAAHHRLGGLLGGDEGQSLRAEAEAWMRAESIRSVPRMHAWLCPWPDEA